MENSKPTPINPGGQDAAKLKPLPLADVKMKLLGRGRKSKPMGNTIPDPDFEEFLNHYGW